MASLTKSFLAAFARTMGIEIGPDGQATGGYTNDPNDPGGETKWGVSKRAHPELDIKNLTQEKAQEVARNDYWTPLRLDELKSDLMAAELFDTGYNCGVGTAALVAQRALNFLGEDMTQDGILGVRTIARLNFWADKDPVALFKCLNGFQFVYYVQCVKSNPAEMKYSRGWMKRINEYQQALAEEEKAEASIKS
jgi:lysozyme family protein